MIPAPLPQGGLRGWLGGLSARDRRIYGVLVGLLLLIIAAYVVSAFFLFSDGKPPVAATATTSPTAAGATQTTAPTPTGTASATPNATASAVAAATQTAAARTSTATASPTRSPTASPSASATAAPTEPPVIIVPPTNPPVIIVPPTEDVPPTQPPAPTRAPEPTAEPTEAPPPTAEPTVNLPTITPEPAPTDVPPTEAPPPTEPPAVEFPTAAPTEPSGSTVDSVVVFFADPDGRVLVPVTRPVERTRQGRTAAINQLIAGPHGSLSRLVPADTRLLGLAIENGRATANFNRLPTFGSESLTDLGLRSVVLALTERTDVTTVQLQVNGQNIGAPRYRPNVNPDNPGQLDGQFATTSFLPLYFPVASTGQMTRIIRLVPRTSTEGSATVDELIAGPGQYADVLARPVPAATRVNSLTISDGVARLDLSQEFLQAGGHRQAVDTLVLALTTFTSVRSVAISIDGTPLESFWGGEFRAPLARPALNRE